MQAFIRYETRYGTLWDVMGTYTIYFAHFSCIYRKKCVTSRHTTNEHHHEYN